MNGYTAHAIPPATLEELRAADDAGRTPAPTTDDRRRGRRTPALLSAPQPRG